LVGKQALVRAWLEGDWNAIEGAFFDEFSEVRHVVAPFAVPADWLRYRSMDWGSARPFSVGWWAVAGDDFPLEGRRSSSGVRAASVLVQEPEVRRRLGRPASASHVIPRGALIRYREWYGSAGGEGQSNVGLKLSAEEVARGIKKREKGEHIRFGVLDPAAFAQSGGPSVAEMMRRIDGYKGPSFSPADNTRVGKLGAITGWNAVRARLRGGVDGVPMLYIFSSCPALISSLPLLQHDLNRPEDLDTEAEDHAADDLRYACLARPWLPPAHGERKVIEIADYLPWRTEQELPPTVGML
jgi:hypothetical protein